MSDRNGTCLVYGCPAPEHKDGYCLSHGPPQSYSEMFRVATEKMAGVRWTQTNTTDPLPSPELAELRAALTAEKAAREKAEKGFDMLNEATAEAEIALIDQRDRARAWAKRWKRLTKDYAQALADGGWHALLVATRERDAAIERAERAEAYAITLQRAIEALAKGRQLPPKELSPHILGLAGEVIEKLVAAETRARDADLEVGYKMAERDEWKARAETYREEREAARDAVETERKALSAVIADLKARVQGAVEAAYAERDMHWKAKVSALEARAQAAETTLEELGPGPFVSKHQHDNACKQREEAFDRARKAEARAQSLQTELNHALGKLDCAAEDARTDALEEAANAMHPMLRSMISRSKAADIIRALIIHSAKGDGK